MKIHVLLLALGALCSISASAYEPLRDWTLLNAPTREKVIEVPGARIVLADYGLLRRDFAELRGLSETAIDTWLLSKTAFISQPQAAQVQVNSPIQTGKKKVQAFRPREYGRALVYKAGSGLIDAKGVGSLHPGEGGHSNGLATTGEAIREFIYEKLVRTVLTHSESGIETVEHYAVIDWGFDVIHGDGSREAAGAILRQAHIRMALPFSLFPDDSALRIELTLRSYGLTSAGAYRVGAAHEMINIQGTHDGAVLDFGGFLSVREFNRPTTNFNKVHPLLVPGQIEFIQPRSDLRVPENIWGTTVSGIEDPKLDNPWIWSHELARDLRRGAADRLATSVHFDNMVGAYRRTLYAVPGATRTVTTALEHLIEASRWIK